MSFEQVVSHPITHFLVSGIVFLAQLYLGNKFNTLEKELLRHERIDEKFEGVDKEIFTRLFQLERDFYALKSVHDKVMHDGGHQ